MEASSHRIEPRASCMKGIVDFYQLVRIGEPVMLRTLPNGRLDAWISFAGGFQYLDEGAGRFEKAPSDGFFPLSNKSLLISIPERIVCLNIKFFPHVLLYKNMSGLLCYRLPVPFTAVFDKEFKGSFSGIPPTQENIDLLLGEVEDYFEKALSAAGPSAAWLQQILRRMEDDDMAATPVKSLAKEFHLTEKTLERNFTRQLGLTPKLFSQIMRFQKTVQDIEGNKAANDRLQLSQSLANGYYDQSHFGKDVKRMTGLPPKLLFKKLLPGFQDLVVSDQIFSED